MSDKVKEQTSGKTIETSKVIKSKSDGMFIFLSILGIGACARIIYEIPHIRELLQKEYAPPQYGWNQYSDLYIAVLAGAFFNILK